MQLRPSASSALGLLLLAACTIALVDASQSLIANRPAVARSHFSYAGVQGQIYAEPSLFGLPNYQAELNGILRVDSNTNNTQGCLAYQTSFNDDSGSSPSTIAVVARYGCSFGQKALMAQAAGASAIIIYSGTDSTVLPKLSGGDDTLSIHIPGMLIKHSDGLFLTAGIQQWTAAVAAGDKTDPYYAGVWASVSYSLLAPDDRVEYDLYTYPDEVNAAQFVTDFQSVAKSLGSAAYFTPHYRIVDGSKWGCLSTEDTCSDDSLPCGNQCTNCGRYCRIDPNGDLDTRPDGLDQVQESATAKCVWKYGDANSQPLLWWQYVNERANTLQCVKETPFTGQTCSEKAMTAVGMSSDAIAYVKSCAGDLEYLTDADNSLMEEELDWQSDWDPLTSPYLYANNMTYFGSFICPTPATTATCGPLSMICQGYASGTAPAICALSSSGCDAGVVRDSCGVCGGTAVEGDSCTRKSSFPTGTVIGVLILVCAVIGGGVYWYMRRQNIRMRDDIDSLLKQYLPLDAGTSVNGGHSAGGAEHSNLRLIGNLESADEPTDL